MTANLLLQRDERGVATLTLNRPEVHNAFDDGLIASLTAALLDLDGDPSVRAVVLTGTGKSFCAGADAQWMRAMAAYDEAANVADAGRLAELLRVLDNLGKPTVARVNGSAFGGGVGLVACCDVAVASSAARFALTEVKLGIVPAVISPYVIAAIGARQARRYFLTAEAFGAEEGRGLGLVHRVASPEGLDAAVGETVEALLNAAPVALREAKGLIRQIGAEARAIDAQTTDHTVRLIARLRVSPEGQEGLSAFLDKRTPAWKR